MTSGPGAPPSPARVALAGLLSLAVAMGIGRFAFTPVLPLMLADGSVDLAGGSALAAANYAGHLVGALLCTLQPALWARLPFLPRLRQTSLIRGGLVATALVTLAVAVPAPAAWPWLRALAGIASAIVLVYTSGWCLGRLAAADASPLGGVVFTGPGVGIVVTGALGLATVAAGGSAPFAWTALGLLALVATATLWPIVAGEERLAAAPPPVTRGGADATADGRGAADERWLLTTAYGLAGFGYIVTATYSPVIARSAGIPAGWVDAFWPLFGAAVVCGALLATRIPATSDRRRWLAGCHLMQAAGIAAGLVAPTVAGFVATSLLLGLPFTIITLLVMEEARRLRPEAVAAFMGLLTSMYGIGQIAGPPLVAWRLGRSASPVAAFEHSLAIAAATLVVAAALYLVMIRCRPAPMR